RLRRERRVDWGRSAEDGVEEIGADNRVAGSSAKRGFEEIGLGLAEDILLCAEADAIDRGGVQGGRVASERSGSAGADRILGDIGADLKGVLAGDANRHRDLIAAVEGVDEIRDATAPTRGGGLVGDA